jgi:hypothetical protein
MQVRGVVFQHPAGAADCFQGDFFENIDAAFLLASPFNEFPECFAGPVARYQNLKC